MKTIMAAIVFLTSLSIISFVVFIKAEETLSMDDALRIGEEKYLKFLWMVDGAFNSERMNNDFIVNGKTLDEKIFTCKYQDTKSKECIGNNFEDEFSELFPKSITYDDVYSDGLTYTWYKYENGKYIFNNLDNCAIKRMALNHQIEVFEINSDNIIYHVSFENTTTKTNIVKDFVIVLEDNEWKIKKAFYYDLCELEYHID